MQSTKKMSLWIVSCPLTHLFQDCWIAGCGVMDSMPEPIGDEIYTDHPQDCTEDISKVTLISSLVQFKILLLDLSQSDDMV